MAKTPDASDPYSVDPGAGIIGNHAYTVLGIKIPASRDPNATYVNLRNPWGADTNLLYFDSNHDGVLDNAEFDQFRKGLNGNNDGIISVTWSDFQKYFSSVVDCELTGPSINDLVGALPIFKNPNLGPYSIVQTQTVGPLDLSAVDPEGLPVTYHLLAGEPGSINSKGQYTFKSDQTTHFYYFVTVVAQSSPFASAAETFRIYVDDLTPTIAAVTATPSTISALGTDLLTLTPSGVAAGAGTVNAVSYWLGTDGTSSFDPSTDLFLGSGTPGTNWSWSGYLGGISSGTYDVFAVPEVDVSSHRYVGLPVVTQITIAPRLRTQWWQFPGLTIPRSRPTRRPTRRASA